jgi:hypothetical protein
MSDRTRYLHKLRRVAIELVHRPGPARQALGLVVKSHQRRGLETLLTTVNWLFIRSLTEGPGAAASIQLLDEGLYQALWGLCFEAEVDDPRELLASLARLAPSPAAVVVLEVDHDCIRGRLARRRRGLSRMDGTAGDDVEAWQRAERAFAQTRAVLDAIVEERGRPLVLTVRNDRLEELPELAEWLGALALSAEGGELRPTTEVTWPWAIQHP